MSKILIVEDEESIAELEKDYLELSGFEVEIENDGEAGLKRAISEEFDLFIPDCGAMCAAISLSTGKQPKYVGKPFKETVDMVLTFTGSEREKISFVGDRLYTDVKTGVANGAHGILVLSGETKPGDLENADTVPDAVFTGLKEMAEIMAEMPGK